MLENNELAKYYDLLYHSLDYKTSAVKIISLAREHSNGSGSEHLDVACGTGTLIGYLKSTFRCTGLDISPAMIDEAEKKFNDVEFMVGDMRFFSLPKKFDVITCLFNSLNYLENLEDLELTMNNFYAHLNDGGIMITEALQDTNKIFTKFSHLRTYESENTKIVRLSELKSKDEHAVFDFHYLISVVRSPLIYKKETIRLRIYTKEEVMDALNKSGFQAKYIKKGFYGEGLFLGVKK